MTQLIDCHFYHGEVQLFVESLPCVPRVGEDVVLHLRDPDQWAWNAEALDQYKSAESRGVMTVHRVTHLVTRTQNRTHHLVRIQLNTGLVAAMTSTNLKTL